MQSIGATLHQLSQIDGEGLEVPANASPIDFLCAVYRDPRQPMHRRLKAATEAAPYIHPKLSASAVLIGDDFASKLERAVKRSEKVLELEATKIEGGGERE
jgi:hypothetical protein